MTDEQTSDDPQTEATGPTELAPAGQSKLAQAGRVLSLATVQLRRIYVGAPPPDSEPLEQHVAYVAFAALWDAIALELDGNTQLGLEAHALRLLGGTLGDPELATVRARLAQLREEVSSQPAAGSHSHDVQDALRQLGHVASSLPPQHEARETIARLSDVNKEVNEREPDTLFRQLVSAGVAIEVAAQAHGAASRLVSARNEP